MTLPTVLSPATVTFSNCGGVLDVNVAVTLCALLMVTVQVGAVPVQSPDHPLKVPFAPQFAVRVTVELVGK